MIVRKIYEFPRLEVDGLEAVEKKFNELSIKRRSDGRLDDEEQDYYDFANNVLMASEVYAF